MSADDGSPTTDLDTAPGERAEGAVLDLTDGATGLSARGAPLEAVIDLRAPGAPYTYPSSPSSSPSSSAPDGVGERSYRDRISVAKGSADVRTAPPDFWPPDV